MTAIPKGTKVRQVVPAIEGVILKTAFNEDTQKLQYLVGYVPAGSEGAEPEVAERWFDEDQVAAIEDQPAADAEASVAATSSEVPQ